MDVNKLIEKKIYEVKSKPWYRALEILYVVSLLSTFYFLIVFLVSIGDDCSYYSSCVLPSENGTNYTYLYMYLGFILIIEFFRKSFSYITFGELFTPEIRHKEKLPAWFLGLNTYLFIYFIIIIIFNLVTLFKLGSYGGGYSNKLLSVPDEILAIRVSAFILYHTTIYYFGMDEVYFY